MSATDAAALALRYLGVGLDSLSEREKRVLVHVAGRKTLLGRSRAQPGDKRTFGERLADGVASFGGSWTFMLLFGGFLGLWTILNTVVLAAGAFDPYPFIFLNLLLSMLAAVQAPIIMMSQNRQAAKDRLDAAHDYEVNLKAEIEILALHEKLDLMRDRQLQTLLDEQSRLVELLKNMVADGRAG
jgi:uncharacterized membrane protein